MNTPAHLIMGAAAFGRPGARRVTWAALAGGLAPDASLYVMVGWSMAVMNISADVVFRDLYYTDAWQAVFAIDNSFVIWGAALAVSAALRSPWAIALTAAALLHLALDLPLHADDARMHFWPLTEWRFYSPISYWDGARGGRIVGLIEAGIVAALTIWLIRRHGDAALRIVFAALALLQLAPFVIWGWLLG